MFTLIVSAALILSNVSLFWVVVKLLKPSQRRICGDERASHASKFGAFASLYQTVPLASSMRGTALICGHVPSSLIVWRGRQHCSIMRIKLQSMSGDGRKRLFLLRKDPAHVYNQLKLCLWCRTCTA